MPSRRCNKPSAAGGGDLPPAIFAKQILNRGTAWALCEGFGPFLDFLYLASGVLAALCLIAILVLIVMQMLARWTGEVFPGAPEYAGYFMAAASFLAFANALNRGSAYPRVDPAQRGRARAAPAA